MSITSLRTRLIIIAAMVAVAVGALVRNYQATSGPGRQGMPVNLGLDLQGGMHLDLELDQSERVSDDPARDIELAVTVLRKRMDEYGVAERLIQKVGDHRIVVELPGVRDPEGAREVVRKAAFLEFRITDESKALERALPAMDRVLRDSGVTIGPAASQASAVDQLLGGDAASGERPRERLRLADVIQPAAVLGLGSMPGEFAVPEQLWQRVDTLLRLPEVARELPRGVELRWSAEAEGEYRLLYALEQRPIITGSNLVDARAQVDPLTNGAEVNFELDRQGGRRFGEETGRHVGDYLAILLDNRVQGRPPVIQSRIERQGRIQMGGKPLAEAQTLALILRAGALPTPLKIVAQHEVGPSLGEDSIRGGMLAGLVGTALVIVIVIGYYGASGALAIVALGVYTLLCFGTLAVFGTSATLTLPGLAGFVLSIGMAVDANVLIFERIREELDGGKSTRLAVQEGFRHAMPAIIDSNLTTVLTALFLFRFGTGPVKGFAVTLIVGILASMVTAIFVTRTLYQLWLRRLPEGGTISIGRGRLFKGATFDFLGMRRKAYAVTGLVLALGVGFLAVRGVTYGVDFLGGSLHQVTTTVPADPAEVRAALERHGFGGAEVQRFGAPTDLIVRAGLGNDLDSANAIVSGAFADVAGPDGYDIVRTDQVSPKVGSELRVQAVIAILLSFVAVLGYLAFRFEWCFGLAAVIATGHDILATIAFIVVLDLEVNLVIVAALLTVVGYSLNDTIVIFDRVRERLRIRDRGGFEEELNRSVNETLPRTVMTGGTALATLAALAIFGGAVIRPFALVMFFGIFTGTFSSIFVASPVLAAVHRRWPPSAARARARAGRERTPVVEAP